MQAIVRHLARLFVCTVLLGSLSGHTLADTMTRHYDGVLGTSMDLSVAGVPPARADAAFDAALSEVSRLEALLSDYQPDSEVSKLNRERVTGELSPELAELISHCHHWESETDGRFSCKLGQIRAAWYEAVNADVPPDRRALRAQARALRATELPAPSTGQYELPDGMSLDLGGIAKGYIIDKVLAAMQLAAPDASGFKVDIGGDGRYLGLTENGALWRVGLSATPEDFEAADGAVELSDHALAASGHSGRTYLVRRREYSQILSSRDGWPVTHDTSAFAIADTALAADVAATVAASLSASDALQWAERQSTIELLVVLAGGEQLASAGWRDHELAGDQAQPPVMTVEFQIPRVEGGKYRRPYVALWITDAERKPIRNLLILGDSHRWAQENRRWWRAVGRDNRDLLDGYARSTRRPGSYTVRWDGRDDRGQLVSGNEFRLHLEAAREHGGHTYQTFDIDLSHPVDARLSGEGEFGDIAINWAQVADSKARKTAIRSAAIVH
ncbi:MAG: DUF2271 domain-containing protein [Pseudomonadota bacterium]